MASIGEAELMVSARTVGRIRVLGIFADSAIYPRLGLNVGCAIHEAPEDPRYAAPSTADYIVRDLTGELRLSEGSDVVGSVVWSGRRRDVRPSTFGHEATLKCTCDLDPWRLEMIERCRNGVAPRFWVQFWPVMESAAGPLDASVRPFDLRVPREMWLEFLGRAGGREFEVLEVQYGHADAEHFRRALARVREARARILEGQYDEAVALCRKVIEAVGHELPKEGSQDPLAALFSRQADERRATQYTGIVSKLKQLAAFAHHEMGVPVVYSRPEAQFVVRVTESLLSLAGALAARGSAGR